MSCWHANALAVRRCVTCRRQERCDELAAARDWIVGLALRRYAERNLLRAAWRANSTPSPPGI